MSSTPDPTEIDPYSAAALREVVLVTGISGSGKSVALHALEDAGYFCVDNLPPELLRDFIRVESEHGVRRMAIAVDVRTAGSLPFLLPVLDQLRDEGVLVRSVFLDATTEALVRRFSETRRPHPLSKPDHAADIHRALFDAIELERTLLAGFLRGRDQKRFTHARHGPALAQRGRRGLDRPDGCDRPFRTDAAAGARGRRRGFR